MPGEEEKKEPLVAKQDEGSWTDELWVVGAVLAIVASFGLSIYFHHFHSSSPAPSGK